MRCTLIVLLATWLLSSSCNSFKAEQEVRQLPFYTSADFTPQWISISSIDYKKIPSIPPFSFTDQSANTITEKSFNNKIYVANFFFTACPGICKQLTKGMGVVQQAFKQDENVMLISHSVTPERDNVKVLKHYAEQHNIVNDKWHLVTGDRKTIYTLARDSYFADEDLGVAKNESDFLHT